MSGNKDKGEQDMTILEFYDLVDGDYNKVVDLFEDEGVAKSFVKMFLEDNSYSKMMDAISNNDWKLAFRFVHSLKGVCYNLDIKKLALVVSEMTEAIRDGRPLDDYSILDKLSELYKFVVENIKRIE